MDKIKKETKKGMESIIDSPSSTAFTNSAFTDHYDVKSEVTSARTRPSAAGALATRDRSARTPCTGTHVRARDRERSQLHSPSAKQKNPPNKHSHIHTNKLHYPHIPGEQDVPDHSSWRTQGRFIGNHVISLAIWPSLRKGKRRATRHAESHKASPDVCRGPPREGRPGPQVGG